MLIYKYGNDSFPLSSKYNFNDLSTNPYTIFSNYSFPDNIRTPQLPYILDYKPLIDELKSIFEETHKTVKEILKDQRKKKSD